MSAREESEFQIKHKMDRKRVWVPLEKKGEKTKVIREIKSKLMWKTYFIKFQKISYLLNPLK